MATDTTILLQIGLMLVVLIFSWVLLGFLKSVEREQNDNDTQPREAGPWDGSLGIGILECITCLALGYLADASARLETTSLVNNGAALLTMAFVLLISHISLVLVNSNLENRNSTIEKSWFMRLVLTTSCAELLVAMYFCPLIFRDMAAFLPSANTLEDPVDKSDVLRHISRVFSRWVPLSCFTWAAQFLLVMISEIKLRLSGLNVPRIPESHQRKHILYKTLYKRSEMLTYCLRTVIQIFSKVGPLEPDDNLFIQNYVRDLLSSISGTPMTDNGRPYGSLLIRTAVCIAAVEGKVLSAPS
ncbi:hypothetical protein J7T55_001587 [Diaporthe amygdali]|uniref:uncharacterized protein n=1 Tax=Phomopsis amygdali TaxID=1214568 RepID=UPI0022FEB3AE|nr:uncharacterized protein J7T55_001587 [Diaporthe amygdali]KAJ0115177.1 hypothetical protein J7T55_001587 [Diaporthe amygdali]